MRAQFDEKGQMRLEEISLLKHDLESLREFKERRLLLEKDLEETRQLNVDSEAAHREAFAQLERKLFEEKQRLQRDAQEQVYVSERIAILISWLRWKQ